MDTVEMNRKAIPLEFKFFKENYSIRRAFINLQAFMFYYEITSLFLNIFWLTL